MRAKELLELRRRISLLLTGRDLESSEALNIFAQRLDAIEDMLGMSYVVPPHSHSWGISIVRDGSGEWQPCTYPRCGAQLRGGKWSEP